MGHVKILNKQPTKPSDYQRCPTKEARAWCPLHTTTCLIEHLQVNEHQYAMADQLDGPVA